MLYFCCRLRLFSDSINIIAGNLRNDGQIYWSPLRCRVGICGWGLGLGLGLRFGVGVWEWGLGLGFGAFFGLVPDIDLHLRGDRYN